MSLFVSFPHMEVRRANAFAGAGMFSLTPVMAACMMGEAFAHHARQHKVDVRILGTLFIHHDAQLMAEHGLETSSSRKFHLQKLKGATLFSGKDVNSKFRSTKNKPGQPVNSDQPNAFMSGRWSLVLEVEEEDFDGPTTAELEELAAVFLRGGCRLAGGVIQSHGTPVAGHHLLNRSGHKDEWGVIDRSIGNGFVVVDQSELLKQPDQGRVDSLLNLLATGKPPGSPESGDDERKTEARPATTRKWFSPAVLGYALISPLGERQLARENKLHAFCESMIGVVELISLRQLTKDQTDLRSLFWSAHWPQSDVFLLTQGKGE